LSARLTGRSESDFARELIEGNIEDLEEVRKELGLDH
jgi:hypothetical protein